MVTEIIAYAVSPIISSSAMYTKMSEKCHTTKLNGECMCWNCTFNLDVHFLVASYLEEPGLQRLTTRPQLSKTTSRCALLRQIKSSTCKTKPQV